MREKRGTIFVAPLFCGDAYTIGRSLYGCVFVTVQPELICYVPFTYIVIWQFSYPLGKYRLHWLPIW